MSLHDFAPTKCGISALNSTTPNCMTACGTLMAKNCPGISTSYCNDQCDSHPSTGGGGGVTSSDKKLYDKCTLKVSPSDAYCYDHMATCMGGDGGDREAWISHWCTSYNPSGGGSGGSGGGGGGGGSGGSGSKKPVGPKTKTGGGGKGSPSHQEFYDTTAGKVTIGIGIVIIIVLLSLVIKKNFTGRSKYI